VIQRDLTGAPCVEDEVWENEGAFTGKFAVDRLLDDFGQRASPSGGMPARLTICWVERPAGSRVGQWM